ncbi:MAG: acylglycerol kinase family protein [Dehalococcoidia bacterium]|nr:acylglycerol kinase family protein [Dehalococcoidia bacterium]
MAVRRAKVIINPVAGVRKNTTKCWSRIQKLLQDGGLVFDEQFSQKRGHARDMAFAAVNEGYGLVIAIGGDGTIHEVANGILSAEKSEQVALGIISTGTGNDLIKSVGIPKDYAQACERVLKGRVHRIDVGQVEYTDWEGQRVTRFFINGTGVGFDAEVADGSRHVPRFMGSTIPFILSLLKTLPFYRNKKFA